MTTLGRQAARHSRPHFPPACPFRGQSRRGKLALFARAAPVHPAPDVDTPPPRDRQAPQVQLVWSEHPQYQNGRHPHVGGGSNSSSNGGPANRAPQLHDAAAAAAATTTTPLDQAAAVELMRGIKAARSWQQLQSILDGHLRSMNHLHVSAVVTHMAQLHATSSSSSSSGDNRTSGDRLGDLRADGPLDDLLHHLDGGSTLHARQSGTSHGTAAAAPRAPTRTGPRAADRGLRHAADALHHPEPLPFLPSASAAGGRLQSLEHPPQPGALPRPSPPLGDARSQFLQRLEQAVMTHLPDFEGRQLANTLWAVAKLGHRPSERWLELVLTRSGDQMHTFNPQHLANTLYALMLLRYMPPPAWLEGFYAAANRRMHGFGPGELSHLCYAAGKLGLRPGRELLGGVLHHSLRHMQAYGVRELALLLYGIVHMGASLHADWLRVYRKRVTGLVVESGALPGGLLERLAGQEAQPELAELARAQLAQREGQQPQQQGRWQGSQEQQHRQLETFDLRQTRGQEQGGQQQHHALSARREGLQREPETQPTYSPNHGSVDGSAACSRAGWVTSYLPTVLCSLAEVGYRPPPVFMATVLAAVGIYAGQLTPVGLTTVLLSLANMKYQPHPALFRRVWDLLMDRLDSLDTQQCTIAVWACATLGCDAPRRDVHAIVMNAAARLPDHSDSEVLQLLEAVTALEFKPTTSWLELVESDLYYRLQRMQPQEVAPLLLPLAGLRHKPHRLWMMRWAEVLLPGLPGLGLPYLAAAVYGAARLCFRPPSQLCSALLAAAAVRMAAAVSDDSAAPGGAPVAPAVAVAAPQLQNQQHGPQLQHGLQLAQGQEPDSEPHQQVRQRRARPSWARRLGDRSGGRLPETLSQLLWALAVLEIRPDESWLAGYMACLRLVAEELSVQERSQVVWALARLRHDPGPEWAEELALWQVQSQQQSASAAGPAMPVGSGAQHATAAGASGPVAAAAAGVALKASPANQLLEPGDGRRRRTRIGGSVDGTVVHAQGSSRGAAGVEAAGAAGEGRRRGSDGSTVADSGGGAARIHGASGSNGGTSSSGDAGVDLDMLVLQGIRDWAARQLSDPAPEATPRRRRAVGRGR